MIRSLFLTLLLMLVQAGAAEPAKADMKEFGEKSASTISVQLLGLGIERPGIYHLPPNIELRDAVQRAKLKPTSIGFKVSRIVDGVRRELPVDLQYKKTPIIPSFVLYDGDVIHCLEESF